DPREGLAARQYLEKRGVTEEIQRSFRLGYAPNAWDGLLRYLTQTSKVAPQTLEEAGLVRRRMDSTTYFDLFRNRLMIPIADDQGRVIAFGGRTLGDDQVKYLNSPETPIYTKGQHLFAFNLAKEAIKERDSVIVVEGYFDAITAHQYGFKNTVATLGTALTEQQAKMLVRYTESKQVYLSFDSDQAGARAVERGVETLNQIAEGIGIELSVIRVPGGKDPDECLRGEGGVALFARAVETAPPLIDYQLRDALTNANLSTHTGRIEAARRIVPILAQIKNPTVRGEYIRSWAMEIGSREDELLSSVGQYRREKRAHAGGFGHNRPGGQDVARTIMSRAPINIPGSGGLAGVVQAERNLLALMLTSREDHEQARPVVMDEDFLVPAHKRIKEALEGIGTNFQTVADLEHKLMDRLAPDKEASSTFIEIILKVEEIRKQNKPCEVVIKDSRARLIKERLELANRQLRALLNSPLDERELIDLQGRILALRRLEERDLPSAESLEDLDELKRKIVELSGFEANASQAMKPELETRP
ncbi:MAG TPA: toprim domain-containing protein, partial [Candidatus Obscuribacterales bacterium]